MSESLIPAEAVRAALDALEAEDGNRTYFTFPEMARVAVEAAAPHLRADELREAAVLAEKAANHPRLWQWGRRARAEQAHRSTWAQVAEWLRDRADTIERNADRG